MKHKMKHGKDCDCMMCSVKNMITGNKHNEKHNEEMHVCGPDCKH